MSELDPIVHQPTRLRILVALSGVAEADFTFLLTALSLSNGNLSSHMRQLEDARYVDVRKSFVGKTPRTTYAITHLGRSRLEEYWRALDAIRAAAPHDGGGAR